jgi:hypothetical protein
MSGKGGEITATPAFFAMFYGGSDLMYWLTLVISGMSLVRLALIP